MKTGLQEFFTKLRFSTKTAFFSQSTFIKFKKASAAVAVVFALLSGNVKWRQTSILNFGKSIGSHLNKTGSSCFSRMFNRLVILPLTMPLCVVMLLGVNGVMGQVTIASQDFESSPATPTWSFSNTNGSASTTNTGTPSSQRIRNGSRSYQFNNAAGTLTFGDITTTGYSSISIVVRISSISATTGNGADAGDYVRLFTKLNSNSFLSNSEANADIAVKGNNNARWGYNNTGTSTTSGTKVVVTGTPGTNQGTIYSTLTITIPNGTNTVGLRINTLNDDANEIWCIDDVTITGTASTFSVTYNSNSATSGSVPSDATAYSSGASVNTAANSGSLARTGYTFAGWNTAANGTGTTYAVSTSSAFTISSNTTLYARWTANTLAITYDSQGGSAISIGSTTTGGSMSASPGTPTKAGYTFNGWFAAASGGTVISFPYTHGQTAAFTLYAQWTANTLAITYDSQGGSAVSSGSTTTGGSISASPGTPTKAGYTFNGWFAAASGGTVISFPYTHGQTAAFTLYAQWTANTLTVTYDGQGGTAISSGSTTTGGSISASPGTPTKAGYTFNGWFAAASGGTAITFSYAHLQTADFTLYAQWTANTLTVTYDGQGGSAISSGSTTTGGSIALSPGAPTQTGYIFNGWFAAASGGSAISFPYTHGQTANFTLYAQWLLASTPTLNSVTLSSALSTTYGTASSGVSFTASGSNLTGNITATAQTGYEVSSDNSTYGSSVSVASGTTVYVHFASTLVVGTYNGATSVVLSGGGAASNVNVTTSVSGNIISAKALTITGASATSRVYDGTATIAVSGGSLSGVVGSDNVTLGGSPTGTVASAAVGNGNSVTVLGYSISGSASGNYTLTQPTGLTANITAKALTITSDNISKVYGTAVTSGIGKTTFTSSGLVNPETIGSVTLTYGTGAASSDPVAINIGTSVPSVATGGTFTGSNYTITYVAGSITVTAKALTITSDNISKVYGATLTSGAGKTTFTSSGLVNSETIGSVTLTYGTGSAAVAPAAVNAGASVPTAATDGTFTASNYTITYVAGSITVTAKALTITSDNISKIYGATLTSGAGKTTFTSSGLVNSETIGSVTLTYGTGSAAVAPVAVNVATSVPTAATGGTFTASNYTITYVAGSITVTAAALTITSDNISKVSGTTLTSGAGKMTFTSSGLVNSETIGSVTLTYGTGAASGDPVGVNAGTSVPTAAAGGTFTASNYTITYVAGSITVTAAPCGTESFTNSNAMGSGSYSDNSFTGDNGVIWTYTQSSNDATYQITGAGLLLRRVSANSKVVSGSVSGGIGNFTCKLLKGFTGAGNRQVALYVNNVFQANSAAWDNSSVQTFTVNDINITGSVVVEIRNITANQVVVDDISWTCYTASPVPQAVSTSAASSIVNTTAILNGNLTTVGVSPNTTEKGFVYSQTSTNSTPEVGGTGVTKTSVAGISTGAYTLSLSGLSANTGYSFRAYAYDGTNYTYGSVLTFTTLTVATKLGFGTTPPSVGSISTNLTTFTVQALRSDNTVDTEFSGSITVAKASGPGNISGTLTVSASSGVATFSSVQFDALGDYTIIASSGALTTVTSSTISILAYAVGDYRTKQNGNWGTSSTWEKWGGSAWSSSSNVPDLSTANVFVLHTVDVNGSGTPPWNVNNLTVQLGGKLWCNEFSGNNDYIQVYGDILCDGTIGSTSGDDISFDIAGGNDCNISGTGSFTASRLRKDDDINTGQNSNVTIDMDVRLTWSSASGTVLYNNSGASSDFNVTINAGKNLRCSGPGSIACNVSIDGVDGAGSGNRGGTYTVYGTLDIDGALISMNDNTFNTKSTSVIVENGGTLKCRYINTGASANSNVLRVKNTGKLTIFGSVDTITAMLNDITWNGYSTTNNTWDFQSGSTIEYSGATQQQVNGITTCSNFIVSGGGLKKLGNDFTVAGMLTLTSGRVQTDAYKLIHTSTSSADLTHTSGSSSFIFGNYRRYIASNSSTYELPVGLSSATSGYRRADILNNNLSGVTYIDASVRSITETANNIDSRLSTTENHRSLTDVLGTSVWSLIPNAQPSSGTYGVKLFVAYTGISSADDNTFCPVKRNTGSSDYADWDSFFASTTIPLSGASGRMYDSGNGYAQRLGYTSFSEHAIGKTSFVVLPISLIMFDAKKQGQNNVVVWSTITEENCDYYTIEKTLDGTSYEIVGKMNGGGNSSSLLEYSLVDYDVRKTLNYYRLTETNTDGGEEMSTIIAVDNRENTGKVVVKTFNILGQEIDENYKGLVIVLFEDGTSIKKVQ